MFVFQLPPSIENIKENHIKIGFYHWTICKISLDEKEKQYWEDWLLLYKQTVFLKFKMGYFNSFWRK